MGYSWLQDACLISWAILDLACLSDLIIEAQDKSQEKPIAHKVSHRGLIALFLTLSFTHSVMTERCNMNNKPGKCNPNLSKVSVCVNYYPEKQENPSKRWGCSEG